MIKTIVFDIGNVMVDYDWRRMVIFGLGMTPEMADRVGEAAFENPYMNEFDRAVIKKEVLTDVLMRANPEIAQELRAAMANMPDTLHEFPQSVPLIRALHEKGLKVYYLSNYNDDMFEIAKRDFGFLKEVDGGVVSCDIHVTKPEPGIYAELVKRYGLDPDEILFFDDLPRNIAGAKKAGFHTWRVTTKPSWPSILEGLSYYGIKIEI